MSKGSSIKYPQVWERLRPYQAEVALTMIQQRRHLNYMEMGMGKSVSTLLAVMELEAFPCILVCTKSAMYVLEEELRIWFNEPATVYSGTPTQRVKIWNDFIGKDHKFIITNFAMVGEVAERFGIHTDTGKKGSSKSGTPKGKNSPQPGTHPKQLKGLVADEIHRGGLFNHKTKTYKVFHKLAKVVPVVYLLTGTPYRSGVVDFYGPLSIVRPSQFDSYWKYVNTHCVIDETPFGKQIQRNPKNVTGFREMIRRHASIYKKTDYLKDMPSKQRVPVPITMNKEQQKVYEDLEKELMAFTDTGELIMTQSALVLELRLRQLLVAPQVLGLKERGAAIDYLVEATDELVAEKDPFVVFTPFRKAVPYISEALRNEYPQLKVYAITGELNSREFADQWQSFQNGRGARVLICVIKSGASFHSTCAANAFFLGYEYDFNHNAQAEDRLYRMGQKRSVTCHYLLHKETVDDRVRLILNDKQFGSDLILSSEEMFKQIIQRRKRK